MVKVELEYTGDHMPKGVVEVAEQYAEGMLASGNYKKVGVKAKKEKVKSKSKLDEE